MKKININQLSDGQRTFLGIVADLTYRLLVLNPNLENPLNGQGIVLIDEIELHLHPKWQQQILINLTKIFPNIQFIVTTHSPQVLSTVYKRQIRQLIELANDDYDVQQPELQTRGVMSSDILERIMGTYSIPDVKESNDLNKLQQYIQEDKYNTPEAELLYDSLKKHFGDKHPEMLNCDRLIQFRKLIAKNKFR
ncbi:AAA family ATPase [Snodgrassella alvi]|uniref:AAA family ATPase n=1 Tax=Snodgrassella alvi TaxID=1196083 RepID=UPI001FD014C3|nr:AAA family ATPase [Snodgrassella alvi]UOO97883.1 AAA family ATPase [Snodgrassella alvi wkB2]